MGLLNWLGFGAGTTSLLDSGTAGLASPWAEPGNLTTVAPSQIFGTDVAVNLPMDRAQAVCIPAVYKARNLLVSSIAPLPLRALNKDGLLPDDQQPTWMYRTGSEVTTYERMSWTVDDIFFTGYSLWEVTRGAAGQILTADWVPQTDWKAENGQVLIRDKAVQKANYLFFNSPYEGLLTVGARTLRIARDMENTVAERVRNPFASTVIRHIDNGVMADQLTQEEIDSLISDWAKARRSVDGSIAYLPPGLIADERGEATADLLTEGRNGSRTDIGSLVNIRASMLDGTAGVDSLTYTTSEGEKNSFFDFDLPLWTDPIAARLSMPDVVPQGQRTRFDKSEFYTAKPTPTGAPEQD